jgi:hypothetical protein
MADNNTHGQLPHSPPLASVVIDLRDIYNMLMKLITDQSALNGKVDQALSNQALRNEIIVGDLNAVKIKLDEHDKVIDDLRARPVVTPKAVWTALAAVISAIGVATAVISVVTR